MTDLAISTVVPDFNQELLKPWRAPEWLTLNEVACLIVGVDPSEYKKSWYQDDDDEEYQTGFNPNETYPIYNIKSIQRLLCHEITLFNNWFQIPGEECFFSADDLKKDIQKGPKSYSFRQLSISAWLIHKGIESVYFQTAKTIKIDTLNYWKAIEWLEVETLAQLICDFNPDKIALIKHLNLSNYISSLKEEPKSFIECNQPGFITPIKRRLDEEITYYHMAEKYNDRVHKSVFTSKNVRYKSNPVVSTGDRQIRYLKYEDGTGEGGEYQIRQSAINVWLEELGVESDYFCSSEDDNQQVVAYSRPSEDKTSLQIRNEAKKKLKEIAQRYAEKLWIEDSDNELRLMEICEKVWNYLITEKPDNEEFISNFGKEVVDWLPDKSGSLKAWLRNGAPDYARKGGAPKKK